uniref:AB hydrolase-1 domain-containing protein n=1 Tax=Megaselia scalaris TaxID=36166 RepID=T1GXQ9_MEGSC
MLEKDENLAIYCIDLPGHGKSSHYPKGMQIVKKHGWEKVTLMGHSLGGALTFMYAASFPNEVEKLINIDIAGPTVRSQLKHAEATGFAIDKYLQYENLPESKLPCYSYDEMVELVLDAYDGSVDLPSVKILMERGMSSAPEYLHKNGFHFSRDLRLKVSLLGMFTEEQVLIYAERIKCKVLNIRAEPGMKFERYDVYEQVIEKLRNNAE